MRYKETSRKLGHLWNKQNEIEKKYEFILENTKKQKNETTIVTPRGKFVFTDFYKYETDWEAMPDEVEIVGSEYSEKADRRKKWIISIKKIPERWIPHIRYIIITDRDVGHYDKKHNFRPRNYSTYWSSVYDYTFGGRNTLFFVEDTREEGIKNIKIEILWTIVSSVIISDFKVKLYLSIRNPDFYK